MDNNNSSRSTPIKCAGQTLRGFLTAMTHEANAIAEPAQAQLRKSGLPAECEKAFGEISNSAENLLGIINGILNLPEFAAGGPEPAPAECAADACGNTMPYGKILVVDDLEANRYVAEGMMQPYTANIESVESGFEAVDLIKGGKIYDIIFMDHMMPEMDGVETTQKIRELGYKGAIVALTANVVTGSEKMFYNNGFDGFMAKPIETDRLDHYMNKFIRDRHPEEAGKIAKAAAGASAEGSRPAAPPAGKKTEDGFRGAAPEMLEIFRRDAIKTIVELRKTVENGDMKHYATVVHAIKSALAYIGEHGASQSAFMLEKAGTHKNTEYINANTEKFIQTLQELANAIPEHIAKTGETDDSHITEDRAFLTGQLRITQFACEDYDAEMAYEALDQLRGKPWKKKTAEIIKTVWEMVYLHSDFEAAAEACEKVTG